MDAFAHSSQPHATVGAIATKAVQHILWNAFSVVSYPQHDLVLGQSYRNVRLRASGMTMNIGEALLQNAEKNKLERTGQAIEVRGHVETGLDAATFRETFHVPFC